CIIADANKNQTIGLGKFLHERYSSMSIEEHLMHIYKICIVHYHRNINKLKNVSEKIKNIMKSIPTLKTQDEVNNIIDIIKNCKSKVTRDWLTDKNTPWVLSAISSAFTKIDFEIWNTSRNNTNVNKSAHHNINLDRTSLSLLAAIKKAEEFDNRE
ncbi:10606_t:CDS:2, partial [Funneliformis geosporum]